MAASTRTNTGQHQNPQDMYDQLKTIKINVLVHHFPLQENDNNPPQSKDNKLDQEHYPKDPQDSDTDSVTLLDIVTEWEKK